MATECCEPFLEDHPERLNQPAGAWVRDVVRRCRLIAILRNEKATATDPPPAAVVPVAVAVGSVGTEYPMFLNLRAANQLPHPDQGFLTVL